VCSSDLQLRQASRQKLHQQKRKETAEKDSVPGHAAHDSEQCRVWRDISIFHHQTEESAQGQAGHHRSRLQTDTGILCHLEAWCRLRPRKATGRYDPPGTGSSLRKQTLQHGKASAISMVPDCRNAHQQIQNRLAAKNHTMGH